MMTTDAVSTTVLMTAARRRLSVKTVAKLESPAKSWYWPRPRKLFSPGRWMFQFSRETAMVTRNGIWVTMIVKTSAGSRGSRRVHRSLDEMAFFGGALAGLLGCLDGAGGHAGPPGGGSEPVVGRETWCRGGP